MATTTCLEVLYQWILEDVGEEPKTVSSKMILFRNQEVFRVALKNVVKKQTLIFVSINSNKIGMKIREVFYSTENLGNLVKPLVKRNDGHDTTLQVFSVDLKKKISGKITFNFYIQIEGSETHFSYRLADRLLKNQLWMAVEKLQWTDIDFIVKGNKISAHKCVLAARSTVFKKEFANDENVKQIIIYDVDFSTFEQFLYFLYTGETNKSFVNNQLLKLADRYRLLTLASLCKLAAPSRELVTKEMAYSLSCITPENPPTSIKTGPMKDTELYFDPKTSTFLVEQNFNFNEFQISNHVPQVVLFGYQNEKMFSAQVTGNSSKYGYHCLINSKRSLHCFITNPTLRMACNEHRNSSYRVVEAVCSIKHKDSLVFEWMKMERRNLQGNGFVEFSVTLNDELTFKHEESYTISFRIKISSTIENYHHEMMDTTCATKLWNATGISEGNLAMMTDVEVSVGSRKFEAHRVVLAARSPVFKAQLEKDNTIAKSFVSLGETVDPDIFEHFLKFLYTGTLNISADNEKLLALAEKYEVETLKKLCQNANQELGVDELTTSIVLAF